MPRSSRSKASARGRMMSARGQARASSVGKRAASRAQGRSLPRTPSGGELPARVERVYRAAMRRRGR